MRLTVIAAFLLGAAGCKNISGGKAGAGAVGAECAEAGECDEVEETPVCLKMPDGYCSASCGGGAFDCDSESVCDQLGDQAFFCLDGCLTENGSGDCRDAYRCSVRPEVINLDGSEVGVCVPRCERDSDCETGRRCAEGGDCVPRGEKQAGEACARANQCNGGMCLQGEAFRGGYCSARCDNQFAECEPGSLCANLEGQAVCLAGCEGDGDCRGSDGYTCRTVATRRDQNGDDTELRGCVPKCQSDAECGDGRHCDPASGDCVDGAGGPNPLGAFCGADADCADGMCLTGSKYRNGYCSAGCDACPSGVCPEERCLAACAADLDCRPGYVCVGGGCSPPCGGDGDCAGEQVCNASSGRCADPVEGAEVTRVDVGSVRVGGTLSEALSLEVPEGVLGFAVLADGAGDDLMVIGEMTDPDGRVVYDFQDPFQSELRFFPSRENITQLVPSSPRSAPKAGRYRFRLIKEGGTRDISVEALIKSAEGEPQNAVLDVNLFFANLSGGLNAGAAKADGDFQAAVEEMRSLLEARGVELGRVSYCDIPGADADRYAAVDSIEGEDSELSRMFALSARAGDLGCNDERALNFFLVQEIVGGRAGYIILGIAGGIPGPPGIHGTSHSGVAVTMSGFRRNPRQLAQTMAHEGAHYLGLFHTTEAEGTAFDPLPDTPECGSDFDDNRDGIVEYGECGGGRGAENLMFWAAGAAAEGISEDQHFVLVRNPVVQ